MSITPTPAQHLAGSTPGNAIVISSAPGDDVSAPGPSMTPRTAPKCPASTPWKERLAYLHRQINSLDKPVAYELLKGFQALSPSQKNYYCNKHWSSSNEDALTNLHDMACLSPKFSTIYYLMLGYSVKKEDALNIANEAERQAALEKVESDYDTIFLEQQEKCKYELKIIQLQSQIAQQSNLKNNIASKKQGERKKEHIAKIMKKIKVLEEEMAEQVMLAGMSIAQRKQIVTGRRDKIVANIAVTGRAAQEVRTQRAERAREAGEERERKKAEDKAAEDAAKAAAAAEKEEAAEQEAAGRLEYLEARYAELQAKGDAAGAARVKRQLKAPARSAGPGQKRKAGADDNATPASKRTRTRASRQEQEQEQEQESHREEEELSAEDLMAAFAADDDEDADADADADAHIPTSATLPTPPQDQSQESDRDSDDDFAEDMLAAFINDYDTHNTHNHNHNTHNNTPPTPLPTPPLEPTSQAATTMDTTAHPQLTQEDVSVLFEDGAVTQEDIDALFEEMPVVWEEMPVVREDGNGDDDDDMASLFEDDQDMLSLFGDDML